MSRPLTITLSITREEYLSLKDEWRFMWKLHDEARELYNALDNQEGLDVWEGISTDKRVRQLKRLKAMVRKRQERRAGKAHGIYEEMEQESLDMASFGMFEVKFAKPKTGSLFQ